MTLKSILTSHYVCSVVSSLVSKKWTINQIYIYCFFNVQTVRKSGTPIAKLVHKLTLTMC